jgi:hypothetical protein
VSTWKGFPSSDSDGWDDGNLGVRGSYGGTNCSPHAPRRDHAWDPEDEYTFRDEEDEHLKGTPSIVAFMNGDGLLNINNILQKSFTVEDVKDISAIKASNMDEISTKEEMLPPHSLSGKGLVSRGEKNDEAMKKTITDASLKVCNAYVKDESNIEKYDPISSSGAKHGEGNSSGRGQWSPMSKNPSQALFESSSKNVEMVKLGSSRGLMPLLKKVHPQVKDSKKKMGIILLAMQIRLFTQYASNCKPWPRLNVNQLVGLRVGEREL